MRCWWCEGELDDELTQRLRNLELLPDSDHVHATVPPSAAELERAGHEALMRIFDLNDGRPASTRLLLPTERVA